VNLEQAVCGTNDDFNTPAQDLYGETEDAIATAARTARIFAIQTHHGQ